MTLTSIYWLIAMWGLLNIINTGIQSALLTHEIKKLDKRISELAGSEEGSR